MTADHPISIERSSAHVRVSLGGRTIAETSCPLVLLEHRHAPVYYVPRSDVRMDLLTATDHRTHSPYKGDASHWTIQAGDERAENAVWSYETPLNEVGEITGYLAFYPSKVALEVTG